MTSKFRIFISTLFLLSLLLGMAQPVPVKAETLSITRIDPRLIYNDVANTITITGTGFAAGAQVRIGGSDITTAKDMVTNYMGATQLKVNIPVDFTPGMYTIYVINDISDPTGTSVYIPAGLTVKTPGVLARPQMNVKTYSTSASYGIIYGQDFKVTVRLENSGGSQAYGVQVTFVASDLLMLGNGGVVSKDKINAGDAIDIAQSMTAATYFYGQTSTPVEMTVSYYDDKGTQYSDKFTLNLAVYNTYTGGSTSATATPTGVHLSQLIISSYKTDIELLQPGLQFKLDLTIDNKGDLPAKSITMIVGGGSSSSGGGTPGPGGVSGSSGDFSNFAPVGTSNVQSLGDIQPGKSLVASQQMIVNVNTNPGAYPMKVTLSYTDSHGTQVNDEQVITLLVFSLPSVDIGFYQPVTELYTYQSNLLPLQVINLGRKTAILGNMTVSSTGMVENGQAFVGSLEPGGYFTLDTMLTPEMAGEVEVVVTVEYTDDFNTARTVTKTLIVNVVEMPLDPSLDPNNPDFNNGGMPVDQPESLWQKIVRFILGLFGLDSGTNSGSQPTQVPTTPQIKPVPMPGGKG
jgi:hypothetical protein